MSAKSRCRVAVLAAWVAVFAVASLQRQVSSASDDHDLARRARAVLAQRCLACHGSNGVARKNIFVLDRDRLVTSRTVVPGDANSLLLKMVESGAMPVGGPELGDDEKATLRAWVLAGAPSFEGDAHAARTFLSESAILTQMKADLATSFDRTRPHLRYFSLANLYNAGATDAELEAYRGALSKLINSLSWHPEITPPAPIDQARTLFRIDLRDYNWSAATWNTLLAMYPYGIRTSDGETIAHFSGSPVPYLRVDWFVANASLPPIYYEILRLPASVLDLERQLGIDASRALEEEKNVVRAGIRASGVSQNNRILERHISSSGAYWKSFDFRSSTDDQNIFRDPLRFNAAGSEIIFNLPNGLQAYFLADARGNRLNQAPINIVADRNNPDDPVIKNGRSCMGCHFAGMQSFKDDVRSVVSGTTTNQFDRARVYALYPPQPSLDQLIEKDRGRFEAALEKTTGRVPVSARDEPVTGLARRFNAELSLAEAAAEAGLEPSEFLARLSGSPRLGSLGYGQLFVKNGGIKRDIWERQYGDLVSELRLGDFVPPRRVQVRGPSLNPVQARGSQPEITQSREPSVVTLTGSLRTARAIFIMTRTVHFNPDDLTRELMKKPEFTQMGLSVTKDRNVADLVIQVDRLAFSTEFPYVVVDGRSRTVVATGQVNSLFGTVPGKISRMFMKQLQEARAPFANR